MRLLAYIDAGTGSLFIQAVLGVVLASTVFLRGFIRKILGRLKRIFSRKPRGTDAKEE